jgi:spindle assembly abnormal protein 6
MLKTSFYNREKPLLERKHVPCELVVSQKDGTTGPRNDLLHKSKGLFTLRVLQGHRSISQSSGATERSIRLELSDEYRRIESHRITEKHLNRFNDTFKQSIDPTQNIRHNPPGPIHFPALQQSQSQVPVHFASLQTISCANTDGESYGDSNDTLNEGRCVNLYELEVGESDFAQLRQDQTLLVEFSDFSNSLIDLLMQCDLGESDQGQERDSNPLMGSQSQLCSSNTGPTRADVKQSGFTKATGPQFRCRIEDFSQPSKKTWNGGKSEGSTARFSIIESNQFRELIHLSLNIEKSTDATIRPYLSARLCEVIGQNAMFKFQLNNEKEKSLLSGKAYNEVSQKYNQLVNASERERNALAQEADESIQKESSKRYEELQIIRRANEEEIHKLEGEMDDQQKRLQSEIDTLNVENERLTRLKEENYSALSSLDVRFIECETNFESSKDEIERLKGELRAMTLKGDNLEHSLKQSESFTSKLEASNEQYESRLVESHKELEASGTMASEARQEVNGYAMQVNSLQEELATVKEASGESRDLLCRYQRDRQEMKRRMKSKVELIQKQEEILASREMNSTDTRENLVEANHTCAQLEQELEQVKKQLVEAEKGLDENKKTLSSNQQVSRAALLYSSITCYFNDVSITFYV